MRNAENLRKVADEIEANGSSRPKFDMSQWIGIMDEFEYYKGHACGTSACIAGYTVFVFSPEKYFTRSFGFSFRVTAMEFLGLDRIESLNLFDASFNATKEDAVAYLRYLADNPNAIIVSDWADIKPWEKKS